MIPSHMFVIMSGKEENNKESNQLYVQRHAGKSRKVKDDSHSGLWSATVRWVLASKKKMISKHSNSLGILSYVRFAVHNCVFYECKRENLGLALSVHPTTAFFFFLHCGLQQLRTSCTEKNAKNPCRLRVILVSKPFNSIVCMLSLWVGFSENSGCHPLVVSVPECQRSAGELSAWVSGKEDDDLGWTDRNLGSKSLASWHHYRKRGSASYIVREWLLWVVERERETPVTSSISRWNREWSCIWLPRQRVDPTAYASTHSEPVECLSACKDKELGAWALEQQGRVIDEWRWGSGSFAFAGQVLWITQQHFVGMLQARRIDQVDVYFLFEWVMVLPLRIAWIAAPFRKRPCAMYKDNAVGNVVAETGRDLVFGTTARLSDLSMSLTSEVRRSPETSARPSAAADSEERQICTTCLFAESVGLCLCFLPSCAISKTTLLETW